MWYILNLIKMEETQSEVTAENETAVQPLNNGVTFKVLSDETTNELPSFIEQPQKVDVKTEQAEVKQDDVVIGEIASEAKVSEEKQEVLEQAETKVEIDDDFVKNYLKQKGLDFETFDDLKPKEQPKLDPETESYLAYRKDTNRPYADFLETQKDWSKEPMENVLKSLMKKEEPYLSNDDIDLLYEDKYGLKELDEFAEDNEVKANRLKEIKSKADYQRGLQLLEAEKEKYKVAKGFEDIIPEDFKKAKEFSDTVEQQLEEQKIANSDYKEKISTVFSNNFEGFEVDIDGQKFVYKPDNLDEVKDVTVNLQKFNDLYFDEKGYIKDTKGFAGAIAFGLDKNRTAKHFFNLGKVAQAEENERLSKNIQVEGNKNVNFNEVSNIKFKVIN